MESFENLRKGDLIKHKADSRVFVVSDVFGDRVTAMATVDLTNPIEWDLVMKASYKKVVDVP